jgi:hypothetical protein
MISLIVWELLWLIALLSIKLFMPKLEGKISDQQTANYVCAEVGSTREVAKITDSYFLFANYIYDSRELAELHPGGYKVIELMKGREVDRFLYGMYSAELYPELPAHSHSANCLQLVGNPIAKLVVPPTYEGFAFEVTEGQIRYMKCIS